MEEEIKSLREELNLAKQEIKDTTAYVKYLASGLDKAIGYIEFIQHGEYVTYKEYLEIKH